MTLPEPLPTRPLPWRVRMLGDFRLERGGSVIRRFRTERTAALLATLCLNPGQRWPRDYLAEILWPETPLPLARQSLRMAMTSLRSTLEPSPDDSGGLLISGRGWVAVAADLVRTDLDETLARLSALMDDPVPWSLAALRSTLEALRQPLLPGLYAETIEAVRQDLHHRYLAAALALARRLAELDRAGEALPELEHAAALDPRHEGIQAALVVARGGDPLATGALVGTWTLLLLMPGSQELEESCLAHPPSPGMRRLPAEGAPLRYAFSGADAAARFGRAGIGRAGRAAMHTLDLGPASPIPDQQRRLLIAILAQTPPGELRCSRDSATLLGRGSAWSTREVGSIVSGGATQRVEPVYRLRLLSPGSAPGATAP